MKKALLLILFAAAGVAANAALIVSDPFATGGAPDYNIAPLAGQGPAIAGMTGNWLSGPGNNGVVAGGLTYSDANYDAASGGNVSATANSRVGRLLSTPYTDASSGTVYLSFLMQTPNAESGSYRSLELHEGGFVDGTHRRMQIGFHSEDFGSTTDYGFRMFNNNSLRSTLSANDGGVNLFVAKLEFSTASNGDQVTVWQNPDLTSGDDPAGGVTISSFDLRFDRVTFGCFGGSQQTQWDELRLGDTFTDVTGAIPEPGTGALAALCLLGLIGRRRRK